MKRSQEVHSRWANWQSPLSQGNTSRKSKRQRDSVASVGNFGRKRVAPFGAGIVHRPHGSLFEHGSAKVSSSNSNKTKTLNESNSSSSSSDGANINTTSKIKKCKALGGVTQTFLDFGQRVFDSTLCEECGMVYAPGVASDEAQHAVFCVDQRRLSSTWLGKFVETCTLKDSCVAEAFSDGSRTFIFRDWDGDLCRGLKMSNTARRLLKRIVSIKSRKIDPEMGFAVSEPCRSSAPSEDDTDKISVEKPVPGRLLVAHACSGGYLSGISVIERIDKKRHSLERAKVSPSGILTYCNGSDETSVVAGVLQIWVAPNARRLGVARKLLDAARQHICYGMVVPRRDLGFSQPTEQGALFAANYCEQSSREIFVYKL